MSVEPPMVVLRDRVLSTREKAREVIASRPDVSPGLAVYLRCDKADRAPRVSGRLKDLLEARAIELPTKPGVEIMTTSFADELLRAWPKAQLAGASEDVQMSFDLAKEHQPVPPPTKEAKR